MVILKDNGRFLPENFKGVLYGNYYICFYKNKQFHRYYGPAAKHATGEKFWWFKGDHMGAKTKRITVDNYSQKQFLKDLNKQWLS